MNLISEKENAWNSIYSQNKQLNNNWKSITWEILLQFEETETVNQLEELRIQ